MTDSDTPLNRLQMTRWACIGLVSRYWCVPRVVNGIKELDFV
jgi:hypothetical protein